MSFDHHSSRLNTARRLAPVIVRTPFKRPLSAYHPPFANKDTISIVYNGPSVFVILLCYCHLLALVCPLFSFVEIECRQDVNQIENYFQILCLTDRREVPQLFIDRKHIGGPKEILLLHRTGDLEKILQRIADEDEEFQIINMQTKEKVINTSEETKRNEQISFT
ncbi:grxC [Acanthosepion pharaonis]|uniref:GrxC n=1 Tax=Acanthosepion pharaonis TaxID=158019 RepID=A0A812E0X1_ACAPH|nr:grxC [Sepia pharaonis]